MRLISENNLKEDEIMKRSKRIISLLTAIPLLVLLTFALVACKDVADSKTTSTVKAAAFAAIGAAEEDAEYAIVEDGSNGGKSVEFVVDGVKYNVYLNAANELERLKINDHEVAVTNVPSFPKNDVETAYIGEEAARLIAFADAGIPEGTTVTATEIKLDFDDGAYMYEVEFSHDGQNYEYDIVATNGCIFKKEIDCKTVIQPDIADKTFIDREKATEIALADAKIEPENATVTKAVFHFNHGAYVYKIEFIANGAEYEYKINAETGGIITVCNSAHKKPAAGTAEWCEAAKKAALAHAGLNAEDVVFTDVENKTKRGVKIFKIEFTDGEYEYEYEINAETGEIISFEKELDD